MAQRLPYGDRTPQYWRAHAEEARARAEEMSNPEGRRIMLEIATLYDEMGGRADREARYAATIGGFGKPDVQHPQHIQPDRAAPDGEA